MKDTPSSFYLRGREKMSDMNKEGMALASESNKNCFVINFLLSNYQKLIIINKFFKNINNLPELLCSLCFIITSFESISKQRNLSSSLTFFSYRNTH